jgi:tetratricopeptide (TPR) repeat protein
MRLQAALSVLLVAATLAAYAGVRDHAFVDLDDVTAIVANRDLVVFTVGRAVSTAFTTTLNGNWIPLTVLSLQLDWALWGATARSVLLGNLVLHAAAAAVLFLALARLTGAPWPSAFVAGVFALHPLHVESVAWAAMRKDSLSALFFMLAILAYAHPAPSGRRRLALVSACLGLALLSKPTAVTLPFVLLLLDAWPLGRLRGWRAVRGALLEKWPLFALAAAACAVTLVTQERAGAIADADTLPFGPRVANALTAYAAYLGQSVWPRGLAVFYPHPADALPAWRVAGSAALLAALSAAAFALRRTRPWWLIGWLWFLGTLVPVIGLVQVGGQARADRYTYLPLVGLAIAVAFAAADLGRRARPLRAAVAALGALALVGLGLAARAQVAHWRDAVALHARAVSVVGDHPVALFRLGNALRAAGRDAEAIAVYERLLEIAPRQREAHTDLGNLYARTGRLDDAVAAYRRELALDPQSFLAHANLGLALARQERDAEARPHLERAIAMYQEGAVPQWLTSSEQVSAAYVALGDIRSRAGDLDAAIADYRRALELDDTRGRVSGNLGMALARAGRFEEAQPLLENALAVHRRSPELQAAMAITFAGLGRPADAVRHYQNALVLRPGWRHAANDLAWILATTADPALRDPEQAIRVAESVLAEPETRPQILDTLAAAYAAAGRYDDAARTAARALERVRRDPELAAAIEARRALYLSRRPYVEAAPRPRPPPAGAGRQAPSG